MTEPLFPPTEANPINTRTQVTQIPGIDATCPLDMGYKCGWPFCTCYQITNHEPEAAQHDP